VRTCVIFNPAARGEKARKFRKQLDVIARESTLKLTASAGDARTLAATAVKEGFETIVAAGGDGTLNEVLNGMGDVPTGFESSRLGILPLGTVNVFAREIGVGTKLADAWAVIKAGNETRIDLPAVEFAAQGKREKRYFAQLAGAGLDARAIELVKWQVKKAVGPFAYVLAGMHALLGPPARITAATAEISHDAALVLIGNGRLYGGEFRLFPAADLRDGMLEVCVLPRCDWLTLARCGPALLLRGGLPASATKLFRTEKLILTSHSPAPVQIDGELVGHLPATFTIERSRLRVLVK
jgi:diacylglycerol kinase (ATP)